MSYEVRTIGDATDGAALAPRPELAPQMKLAIAAVVAVALVYQSKAFAKWERSLSTGQRVGLAVGVGSAFVLLMIAINAKKQREMQSFQRDPPGFQPSPDPNVVT